MLGNEVSLSCRRAHGGTQSVCPVVRPGRDAGDRPRLVFSTRRGGGGTRTADVSFGDGDVERGSNPASEAFGHIHTALHCSRRLIAPTTASCDFPTTARGDKTCEIAASDCNAAAFSATLDTEKAGLTSLLYSTYLEGDGADSAKGIALEPW